MLNNNKIFRAFLCVLLIGVMLLTACGGDGHENSSPVSIGGVESSGGNTEDNTNSAAPEVSVGTGSDNSDKPDNSTTSSAPSDNSDTSDESSKAETSRPAENNNETSKNENSADNSTKETEYSVYAVDGSGNPIANLIVQISGDGYSGMKTTSAKGVAKFTAEKGRYTIKFVSPSKDYYYDTDKCVLSESVTAITVTLLEKAKVTASVNAFSPKSNDYKDCPAYDISEGMLYAPVSDGEMTYFIFVPTRSGTFEVSVSGDTEFELGYYGMPIYVHQNSLFDVVDNKFELEIHNYNIGSTRDTTSTYVIGVKTVDGDDGNCILSVTRTGDAPWSIEDEPWRVATADKKYLVKYEGESGKKLKDIDILSKPTVVFNEADGYYHYGTADGPLVLIRIDSDANYLGASLIDVCDTSTFGIYAYNDDGSFAYRERYNELLYEYKEICDANGVCPLNEQLAQIIKDVGEYKGWWKASSAPGYIFGSAPAYKHPDYAWLFCCCYYE